MNHNAFIKKANLIHGNIYDYSLVNVNEDPITIICQKHGIFKQKISKHLYQKRGCPQCGREFETKNQTFTTIQFITNAKKIHSNKYNYSLSEYINCDTKLIIICPEHGQFKQTPYNHINKKSGCPKCAHKNRLANSKFSKDKFLENAKKIHGDKYDYSLSEYINCDTKLIIICPEHGQFKQTPYIHINKKSGCPKCANYKTSLRQTKNFEDFVIIANYIHNNKYKYDCKSYKNRKTKTNIICPVHGLFEQTPDAHINKKCGCLQCSKIHLKLDTKEFIKKSQNIHQNKYDYSKTIYNSYYDKISIICKDHGEFKQTPNAHLAGSGCPVCPATISNGHKEICDFLKYLNINFENNNKSIINPYEIDIFIPKLKIGIEYHGLYFHSSTDNSLMYKHYKKANLCSDKDILLLQIFENEWKYKSEIIKSMIKSKLNINNKIYARKCSIFCPSKKEFKEFMDNNHLYGNLYSKISLGLKYEDEYVCMLGVNPHETYEWEITRYANKININVIGGASKLLNYFITRYNPSNILTFADRRYSNGNLYKKLNFQLTSITKPNYFYVKQSNLYSRIKFQKHKLFKLLENYNENLSESENMFNNGFRKIYDAGHYKFILSLK